MTLTDERKRQYQREWVAKRKAEWFAGKVCVGCGTDEELRLDHIDPLQKVSHRIWSWSAARREIELAKCQVLCHPCHLKKTTEQYFISRKEDPPKHGTRRMYERGCKCEDCTEPLRMYWRERRAKKKISDAQ